MIWLGEYNNLITWLSEMLKNTVLYTLFILTPLMLTGCGDEPRFKKDSVWDLYDIRTPLPADAQIRSRAAQYDRANSQSPYQTGYPVDNDAYYTPPTGMRFGVCGEGGVGSFNCD